MNIVIGVLLALITYLLITIASNQAVSMRNQVVINKQLRKILNK